MKKTAKLEERKNYLLYEFLEKLNREVPFQNDGRKLEEAFVQQYKMMVNMSFSANILYKGLDYASQLYNHIAKIEYTRLHQFIIHHQFDPQHTEILLKRIKKAHNELVQNSPRTKKSEGVEIFYGFTGGNRKKYKMNRKAITQMYIVIKKASEQNRLKFVQELWDRGYQKLKMKKAAICWRLKSYTWR
ncbi:MULTISPECIES: hypothetical protein [unclassified Enterococcus]|uniref:hypothetical protein n=1 Tax=unclassified Enterococcus TaxID=2608891 RepID=UPI001CE1AF51|nr:MULTISPECIES: hypothetical protein [unclassified Enterococcus]MCA5012996.1 hypothetical protein [Enterococcus sp. S23]MCA5016247.1 hypothetical protein [Enterococcus sp. S22(2020)]